MAPLTSIVLCALILEMECVEYFNYHKAPCDPGDLVFVDCNLCTCNREGEPNQVCAKMWCPPTPTQSSTSPPLEDTTTSGDDGWEDLNISAQVE